MGHGSAHVDHPLGLCLGDLAENLREERDIMPSRKAAQTNSHKIPKKYKTILACPYSISNFSYSRIN
jgi:hypothetical protein